MKKSVALVEVPLSYGQKKKGVEKAPEFFRKKEFEKLFFSFKNITYESFQIQTTHYYGFYKKALEVLKNYDLCLFLGGDHSG